jgi:hypothetical protein
MSLHHVSCAVCRIRLRATAPEIELLDGMCPICGLRLQPATDAASVLGFRSFDWGDDGDQPTGEPSDPAPPPTDMVTRRRVAAAAAAAAAAAR